MFPMKARHIHYKAIILLINSVAYAERFSGKTTLLHFSFP